MTLSMKLCACAFGALLLAVAIRGIVRRVITAKQSLFWIFTGVIIILFSLFPGLIFSVAGFFGAEYAPSIFLFIGVLILFCGVFYCFERIAKLRQQVRDLAINLSLMNAENLKLRKMLGLEDENGTEKQRENSEENTICDQHDGAGGRRDGAHYLV